MDDRMYGDTAPNGASNRKALFFTGLGLILVFFLLDDLAGWIGGGGIFSVTSALHATRERVPLIDVDHAGLRTFFIAMASLAVTAFCLQLDMDPRKRLPQILFLFAIMGGGFVLDGFYGERIITHFMTGHGYGRCTARDHAEGNGKSRVWFDNYVRNNADCPSLPITIVPAPAKAPPDLRSELPRPARPISPPLSWFTDDDYPDDAIRQNLAGVTTVVFVIDTGGRVRQCKTVKSSGSPLLDATACSVLVTNARYWPARDPAGNAVAEAGTFKLRWQLPKD